MGQKKTFSDHFFSEEARSKEQLVSFFFFKQVCSDVESTNRCLLKSIELPEAFWCCTCISGSQGHYTLGPGFSGAARFSLSRRAHVKAKGSTLDSVEQKNYAVGGQKVGQPRTPTSCVLSFFLSWRPITELEWSNERFRRSSWSDFVF